MKKDLIPKSKAKTAYGLLSEVRKLILEEPKRYDQGIYIARINGANDSVDLRSEYRQEPACGTVACVAGWVATLKRGSKFGYDEADEIASEILGLSESQSIALFDGGAVRGFKQTPEFARAGAEHIAAFQKKHATQLKAKRV